MTPMPMNRILYPSDWNAIARRVKEEAGWMDAEQEECMRQLIDNIGGGE